MGGQVSRSGQSRSLVESDSCGVHLTAENTALLPASIGNSTVSTARYEGAVPAVQGARHVRHAINRQGPGLLLALDPSFHLSDGRKQASKRTDDRE